MDAAVEWDAASYAANSTHHRRYDGEFLAGLPLRDGDRVLDVGCGSGELTARLATATPAGHVVGLDPSAAMLDHARRVAADNQSFVHGPAQRLVELVGDRPFDVVVSRAALHWLPAADQRAVLAGIARVLRPDGWLRIECGGDDNVTAVVALLDEISARHDGPLSPWSFPRAGWFLDLVESSGFDLDEGWVRLAAQRRRFDRDGLIGWMDSQVLPAYTAGLGADAAASLTAEALARVDELGRADGSHDVTFVRLDVRARRSDSGTS